MKTPFLDLNKISPRKINVTTAVSLRHALVREKNVCRRLTNLNLSYKYRKFFFLRLVHSFKFHLSSSIHSNPARHYSVGEEARGRERGRTRSMREISFVNGNERRMRGNIFSL